MSEIDPYTVVKWIMIVLAAGFIGQFGKTFAQYLMRRTREKAVRQKTPAEKPVSAPSAKKPLYPENISGGGEIQAQKQVSSDAVSGISDEKTGKKAAKAKKKEIKLLKKIFK